MLLRSIRAEACKLRRSFIWLALAALPLLSATLGTLNYLNNLDILTEQWYSLWIQHTLFYCSLFAPALTGVYCAYICRLEHLNRNWNQVMTLPVTPPCIVLSKLSVVSLLSLLTQAVIGVLFLVSGLLAGLPLSLPPELPLWLARGWLALTVEAAVLLFFSLIIRSFAVPVGLGLLGAFLGLAAMLKGLGLLFPFSLLPLGMCSNNPSEPMQCNPLLFFASALVFLLLFTALSITYLQKTDVKT